MKKILVCGKATRVGVEEDAVLVDARTEELVPPDFRSESRTGVNWEVGWYDPEDCLLFAWRKKDEEIQAGVVILVAGDGLRVVATVCSDGILKGLDGFSESCAAGWKTLLNIVRANWELSGFCNTDVADYHRVAGELELPQEVEHIVRFEGYSWTI